MNENSIKIINQSIHKNMTDNHLAQINFTAIMPKSMFDKYINTTNIDHENLGRIRFMRLTRGVDYEVEINQDGDVLVFGRVSHGYGYGIEQDIFNSIVNSKGAR
jgi:hypothetical protein